MRPQAPRLKKFRATPEASSQAVLGARANAAAAAAEPAKKASRLGLLPILSTRYAP